MSELLRGYISLIVEKIRSAKFDMRHFKSLTDRKQLYDYANEHLEFLGAGSSRAVFVLSNRYAVKVARNRKGVGQNEAEKSITSDPQLQTIITHIHAADPNGQWVITDLVRPLASFDEFEQLVGIDWQTFSNALIDALNSNYSPKSAMLRELIYMIRKHNLLTIDIIGVDSRDSSISSSTKQMRAEHVLQQWGKTPDGRIVLLDYGFTRGVRAGYYE